MNTVTNPIEIAVQNIAEAIATEVLKSIQQTIEQRVERAVQEFVESQDFHYILEDNIKDKMEEVVDDHISNISLSVRID